MPKIEVSRKELLTLAGISDPGDAGLEDLLIFMKGELDTADENTLKIELNDTNRPDLWSVEGVARAIRCKKKEGSEDHLASMSQPALKLTVEPAMESIRPYIAGFRATGWKLDAEGLESLLAVQEKLTESFGKKRSLAAIGFHRAGEITYPVRYAPSAPTEMMLPLGCEEEMTLSDVLTLTEKGMEYAHLLEGFDRYPVLTDSNGRIFSFPPVLNSNTTGKVRAGDDDLFCDVTGTDWETVQLTATILACNLEDRGAVITPVEVEYPYEVPGASGNVITPVIFSDTLQASHDAVQRILGAAVEPAAAREALLRMDYASVDYDDESITGVLPPYRRDGIHPVDLIEYIIVSIGLDVFEPLLLSDFTIGRSSEEAELAVSIRMLMVCAGCEEILRPVLSSSERITGLSRTPELPVVIRNPMTAEYGVVRNTLLPGLLDVESTSGHAAYPHRTFETGEVLLRDDSGLCRTGMMLASLVCGNEADFADAHSILGTLCGERGLELVLEPSDDPRFIPGRSAAVLIGGKKAGMLGEINPAVLIDWGITRPAAGFEIDLSSLGG